MLFAVFFFYILTVVTVLVGMGIIGDEPCSIGVRLITALFSCSSCFGGPLVPGAFSVAVVVVSRWVH